MITLKLTKDEYDTICSSLDSYIMATAEQMEYYAKKNQQKYYYWDVEYRLAKETLEEIQGKEDV